MENMHMYVRKGRIEDDGGRPRKTDIWRGETRCICLHVVSWYNCKVCLVANCQVRRAVWLRV
jgi:hypothetical protein